MRLRHAHSITGDSLTELQRTAECAFQRACPGMHCSEIVSGMSGGSVRHSTFFCCVPNVKLDDSASLEFRMISFSNINKQYGKQLIFVDASFQLNPGEKVGLVGPNGAGKTTLFRMVTGEETPDEGGSFSTEETDHRLFQAGCGGDERPVGPG
jgi:ABC-type molybdenum transport system ATPase subunit/photorepair protein PhrA